MTQTCKRGHVKPATGPCKVCLRARQRRFHHKEFSLDEAVVWAETTPRLIGRDGKCKRGHPYTPPPIGARGYRSCPTCQRSRQWSRYRGLPIEDGFAFLDRKPVGTIKSPPPHRIGRCKPGLEATETPTLGNIIWAAGFYEGEGSVGKYGCTVGQKDRWSLEKLKRQFGGSIGRSRPGIPEYKRNDYWAWHISGSRARGFLMTIYSFLSPRRQAQVRPLFAARVAA